MIQNVAGAYAQQPRFAASNGQDADRDALRFNGARERGFAFGRRKHDHVVDEIKKQTETTAAVTYGPGAGGAGVLTASNGDDVASTTAPVLSATEAATTATTGADTNAVAVTKDGSFNINVTITGEGGTGGKGVIHFEEGGSYAFSLSDHPGAKYRLVGLDGGNGSSNPNNIKGTIFLNGAEIKLGDLKDKVSEFLRKRDEIAAKPDEVPGKQKKRAGDITLDDLKAFNLLPTPDVGVLNIHDDRFDKSKFTDKQVLSLKVAAKLATNEPLNPIPEDEEKERGQGLKLGHAKDGHASYGRGLKLGHQKDLGILAFYA
ncbi:hypothetical protein ACFO5Q_06150 [Kordiimonas lipolytica]|uniref:Uncharacterized protein n=1 Tax=Kordiimonas lipolytica TaxID=1662421 RepID=A0ABV8U893_9PROT|nr:hypothetical protein [Kordiimonas lipolytica]